MSGFILPAIALLGAMASSASAQQVHPGGASVLSTVTGLKSGEYVWEPQIAPKGPLLLIVSLPNQRALLFRNGVPIAASTVSTGKAGFETPAGIFTVLQKKVEHYSSKYDNAPMPYMQRLTWRGVALHAGNLPGYPASHGCIRLPKGFAKLLYTTTTLGMTVVISDRGETPRLAPTPDLALRGVDPLEGDAKEVVWTPERSPRGPVSIVVSSADGRAVVLRNGVEIGSSTVHVEGPTSGSWAYLLRNIDGAGQHWLRLELSQGDPSSQVPSGEWSRFHAPEAFRRLVAGIIAPGSTIIVTSDSLKSGATGTPITVLDDQQQR